MIQNEVSLPSLRELGPELLRISWPRRLFSLLLPFLWSAAYFAFAALDYWPAAFFATVALSFVTYGSVSHDLVHRNLGLSRWSNDVLLSIVELLALRSGHAYQAAHLHHHARFPHEDDVESLAARRSLLGALLEGFAFQFRIWRWAVRHADKGKEWIIAEGVGCGVLIGLAFASTWITPVFLVYVALTVMGSWIIPLVTSYVPHDPRAKDVLGQTRVFRGVIASLIALEHLYHLEHHLYPAVPHHHWPELAKRLDPHLAKAGVEPIKFWI